MKWDSATAEELQVVNDYLKKDAFNIEVGLPFKRFAKKLGGSDKLVQFEQGVPIRVLKVEHAPGEERTYVTLHEERNKLFLRLNESDFEVLFTRDSIEALGQIMLWAIKQHNRRELEDGNQHEGFGSF